MNNLTSWSFADYIRQRIDVTRTHDIDYYYPALSAGPLDSGTTHLSVQSPDGAAVAVTSTVNSVYACVCFYMFDFDLQHIIINNNNTNTTENGALYKQNSGHIENTGHCTHVYGFTWTTRGAW